MIIFYIIKTASEYETALTTKSVNDSMQQISYIVESLFNNKEMILFVIAMVVTITAVYAVRRLKIDNAWTYAIAAGIVVQFIVLLAGILVTGAKINLILMIVGTVLGGVVGYLCQILFFSVDYSRTEYVQYEDDEYYYYVKAVPKALVATSERSIKKINGEADREERRVSEKTADYTAPLFQKETKSENRSAKRKPVQEESSVVEKADIDDIDFEKKLEESLKDL